MNEKVLGGTTKGPIEGVTSAPVELGVAPSAVEIQRRLD